MRHDREHLTEREFMSYKQLDMPLRRRNPTSEEIRSWELGISAYDTLAGTRRRALSLREIGVDIGSYIAEIVVPEGGVVRYEKTGGSGHFDLIGEPQAILECVRTVAAL